VRRAPVVWPVVLAGLLAPIAVYTYRLDFAYTDNFNTFAVVATTTWPELLALLIDGRAGYRPLYYPLVKIF
jgi:hypothetical protein